GSAGNRVVMHVPDESVHAGGGAQALVGRRPIEGQAAIGQVGIFLAELVVGGGVARGIGITGCVGGGVGADDLAGGVEDFELHVAGRGREIVVDHGAVGRVLAGGHFGRPRRGVVGGEADAHGGRGLEEEGGGGCGGLGGLAQGRDVVEDPEAA